MSKRLDSSGRQRPVVGPDKSKQCRKCGEWFLLDFFATDRSSSSGKQAWCRLCKALWERGPENAWKRFKAMLEREEPESLRPPHGWTEQQYLAMWTAVDGKCEWCGSGLGEWQHSGHRLDRIDNNTPHIPANCQMLCWVCNRRKSNRPAFVAMEETLMHVRRAGGRRGEQAGLGRVPWQDIEPWARRVELPDPEPYRIALPMEAIWGAS